MSSTNRSVTETTITFRATSADVNKIKFINEVLAKCGQAELENTSETLRWGVEFIFKILRHAIEQRAGGNIQNSTNVSLLFLQLAENVASENE